MASTTAIRAGFMTELLSFRPTSSHPSGPFLSFSRRKLVTSSSSSSGFWTKKGTGEFPKWKRASGSSRCLGSGGEKNPEDDQGPPQEAVLKAISEVSKAEGRVGQTTNMVIGGTVTDDSTNEWVALDQKVNSYPTVRGFTAIGTGGDDFVQSMVVAVESVIQEPIPEGRVRQKVSARGKYVSVNIGPVQVFSSEQVQAVYNAMKSDDRMKYFL